MKIIRIIKLNKILNLKFIKNKVYKKNNLILLKLRFKKILNIFFKFHLLNKKIFFLGVDNKFNDFILKLIKNTKHSFILDSMLFKGILTNPNMTFKHLVLSKSLVKSIKFLFNSQLKINLIVILNHKLSNLNELSNLKVPIISLTDDFNRFYDYKVNFSDKISTIFFLNILKKKWTVLKHKIKKSSFGIKKN